MLRKYWSRLLPGLVMGVGIGLAVLVAKAGGETAGAVMAALLLMVLITLAADALETRQRRPYLRPSWAALILAGCILLCGLILEDPHQTTDYLPILGAAVWSALLSRGPRCTPRLQAKPQ